MVSSGNVLPPSKDEQDSMAKFWALEEANAPRGWEGEQELDYAEISSKRTAMERRYMEDSQNSGQATCSSKVMKTQLELLCTRCHFGPAHYSHTHFCSNYSNNT